jgi:hypothetical protein
MEWIGLAIFLVLIFGGGSILSAFREYSRQRHIERVIAQLPEAERGDFVKSYLKDPAKVANKFSKTE